MRLAAVAALAATALVVVGCGGKSKPQSIQPPLRTAPTGQDRGKEVVDAFVAAAGRRDAQALWMLLSAPTQQRLGPFLRFSRNTVGGLAHGVGSLAAAPYREIVSQRITDGFGVVAIDGGSRVYALALRLEEGAWRVELASPVHIEPLGVVDASTTEPVVQVGAEIRTSAKPPGLETAVAWIDGLSLDQAQIHGSSKSATLFANLTSPVRSGRHTVVVFAGGTRDASAAAWTFAVRGGAG